MKLINNTLNEQTELNYNENKKMAKFLKRRRQELGLTLEHVSEGICSTSYLSKIENCQVEVDETYFNLLFEKLDLHYEDVIENRKVPIYSHMIQAYLENDKEFIKKSSNDLVVNKTYCETEIELLVVFYNLIFENYQECKNGLDKLISIQNTLLSEEYEILLYLEAIYHFKTNNFNKTLENLRYLYQRNLINDILKVAVDDLTLDFCFEIGEVSGFYNVLKRNKDNIYLNVLKRVDIKHQLQELVLKPSKNKLAEFEILKLVINNEYMDLYDYYYTLSLIYNKQYLEAYEYCKDIEHDQDFLLLKAIIVNNIDEMDISYDFLMYLRKNNINKFGVSYEFIEYVRIKLEKYSYMQLYNYLKNVVFTKKVQLHNKFLLKEEIKELLKIAYELGKYKEIVKLLKNTDIDF